MTDATAAPSRPPFSELDVRSDGAPAGAGPEGAPGLLLPHLPAPDLPAPDLPEPGALSPSGWLPRLPAGPGYDLLCSVRAGARTQAGIEGRVPALALSRGNLEKQNDTENYD